MKKQIISYIFLIIALIFIVGCSTLQSNLKESDILMVQSLVYCVNVETQFTGLDALITEYALIVFDSIINIEEQSDECNGIMEINFLATPKDAYTSYGGSGGSIAYIDSTMFIILRDNLKNKLWIGEYIYKGGWEMSGFVNTTPAEAAKHSLEKLSELLGKDLVLK